MTTYKFRDCHIARMEANIIMVTMIILHLLQTNSIALTVYTYIISCFLLSS